MPEIEEFQRRELRIDVRVSGPCDAREIARILVAMDRGFASFARVEYGIRNGHLRIERTGAGSWWAILTAGKEIYDLSRQYPDIVPIFAQNLEVAMKAATILGQEPGETAKYARDLLRDLAKAGRKLGADAIEIASLTTVVIKAAYFEPLERSEDGVEDRAAANVRAPEMLMDRSAVLQAAEMAERSGLIGTVFKVAGDWYVRAEGMFGVLIPLKFEVQPKLVAQTGELYEIEGTLLRSPQGHPIGVAVRRMSFVR